MTGALSEKTATASLDSKKGGQEGASIRQELFPATCWPSTTQQLLQGSWGLKSILIPSRGGGDNVIVQEPSHHAPDTALGALHLFSPFIIPGWN